MKYSLYIIPILFVIVGCKTFEPPKSMPTGTWNYKLFMNGSEMGHASVTSAETSNLYISTLIMSIKAGDTQSTTKEIVTETKDFVPVKFETYNQVILNGQTQNIDTVAIFNGKEITVKNQDHIARIIIDKPFVLPGNYLTKVLLDKGFEKNTSVTVEIYSPLLELEDTVTVKQIVVGTANVEINGIRENLLHLKQIMADFQESDVYLDSNGVLRKIRILMLNNLIEMVIEK
ncbi:MAG: hypothetical protein FWG92_01360 [Leptospirales bacterium]|nr:hypothetical protein [Leptospirales bacterium]